MWNQKRLNKCYQSWRGEGNGERAAKGHRTASHQSSSASFSHFMWLLKFCSIPFNSFSLRILKYVLFCLIILRQSLILQSMLASTQLVAILLPQLSKLKDYRCETQPSKKKYVLNISQSTKNQCFTGPPCILLCFINLSHFHVYVH